MSNSLQPHGLHSPWNSPGQNTGAGSHSLLQGIFPTQGSNPGLARCRRLLYQLNHKGAHIYIYTYTQCLCPAVKSCPTLCTPMHWSSPGSFVHGIHQSRILEWVAVPTSRGSSLTQGSNPGLPHCRRILYQLSHQGSLPTPPAPYIVLCL